MKKRFPIVVAWVEEQDISMSQRIRILTRLTPHACMWLRRGTEFDIQRAHDWVSREHPGGRAIAFRERVDDPLAEAKKLIMEGRTS